MLTMGKGSFRGLGDVLRNSKISVRDHPLISFLPPPDWTPVDRAIARLASYDAVAFTSPRAAEYFVRRLRRKGLSASNGDKPGSGVWVSGAETAHALGGVLGSVRVADAGAVGRDGAAIVVAQAMLAANVGSPVLFPCGDVKRDDLQRILRDAGVAVDDVVCYRGLVADQSAAKRAFTRARLVVVGSPSVMHLLASHAGITKRPALVVVGPSTEAAARAGGWPPDAVAPRPTVLALAEVIRSVHSAIS